jgi:O-antigen/teichoic acid export membrane protein
MAELEGTDPPAEARHPLSRRGLSARIMRAMSAQMAAQALRIVQQILLVPLFLRAWGIDIYTDWLVIGASVSFAGILDGGMQAYFSGLLQERLMKGDTAGYRRAARIAGFNYLVVILFALVVAAGASSFVDWRAALGIHALTARDAYATLGLLGANALISLPIGMAGSLYKANGEYDRGVMVALCNLAVQIVIPASLLAFDQPIAVVAAGTILSSLLGWVLVSTDQRIRYGGLPWGLAVPTAAELRTTVTQCALFNAQPVATWMTIQGPVLILGHLGDPTATVAFATTRTLVGVARQLTLQLATPFGFELSVLIQRDALQALGRLLENAVSIIGIIGGLLTGLVIVSGIPLSILWLHGRVALQQPLIVALALPVAVASSAQIYQFALAFSNRPRLIAQSVLGHAVIGLLFALLLAPSFGAVGIAAGLGIGESAAIAYYLPARTLRSIHLPAGQLQRASLLRAILATALSYLIARAAALAIPPTDLPRLIAFGCVWAIISALCAYAVLLDRFQRSLVKRWIAAPRR